MPPILIFAIIFAVYFVFFNKKKEDKLLPKSLEKLAQELSLNIEYPSKDQNNKDPILKGYIDEGKAAVKIYMERVNLDTKETIHNRIEIYMPGVYENHFLQIQKEGFLDKINKRLGSSKDIQIRDEEFDSLFLIEAKDAFFAKSILMEPDLRALLIRHKDFFDSPYNILSIQRDTIQIKLAGNLGETDIYYLLLYMYDVAEAIYFRWKELREEGLLN